MADVEALEGFGRKSATNLVEAVVASRGRSFVLLTGAFPGVTRDEAAARIETPGGRVSDTVSRRTDSVVVGEAAGRKLEQAHRLGVRALGPAEFEALLAGTR